MPAVAGMEALVRTMKMRGPVTLTGANAEQVAVESLLALASLPLKCGPWDLVPSLGTTAK